MVLYTRHWNFKQLIINHAIVILLILSLFWQPAYQLIWKSLDEGCFKFLKWILKDSPLLQNFWAMANHKKADLVEDFCFFFFSLYLIFQVKKGLRIRKAAELLFFLILSALTIMVINHLLFRHTVDVRRDSPSLLFSEYPRLSKQVTWLYVKDVANKTFPADHATTAYLFSFSMLFIAERKKLIAIAFLYGTFLSLPRLFAGAHWLTDILIGSGSIILFTFTWALCTPTAFHSIRFFEKCFFLIRQLVQKVKKKSVTS